MRIGSERYDINIHNIVISHDYERLVQVMRKAVNQLNKDNRTYFFLYLPVLIMICK